MYPLLSMWSLPFLFIKECQIFNFGFCLILDSDILEIPQFVANQSGSGWLLVDSHGFTYSKERTKKLKTYWKCSKRISSKCCARVSTVEMNIVSRSGQHNHLPPKKFEIQV